MSICSNCKLTIKCMSKPLGSLGSYEVSFSCHIMMYIVDVVLFLHLRTMQIL